METGESYYPRIESVQDSLGNTWTIGQQHNSNTGGVLRPGDQLQFKVTGSDPLGENIEFAMLPIVSPLESSWNSSGDFDLTIHGKHVQERLWIHLAVRSVRKYHAKESVGLGKIDDLVFFSYEVLPPRTAPHQ